MNTLGPRSDRIDWDFVSTATQKDLEAYVPWINLRVNVTFLESHMQRIVQLWDTGKYWEHNVAVLEARYARKYISKLLRGAQPSLRDAEPNEIRLMNARLTKLGFDVKL